jgi:hypothetical protein
MTPVNAFAKWLAWGVCGMQGKWGSRQRGNDMQRLRVNSKKTKNWLRRAPEPVSGDFSSD